MDGLRSTGGNATPSTYNGANVEGKENIGFENFADALIEATESLKSFYWDFAGNPQNVPVGYGCDIYEQIQSKIALKVPRALILDNRLLASKLEKKVSINLGAI